MRTKLENYYVPPISDYDPELGLVWFIPREIIRKKTKNGKPYWIVAVIDSNSVLTKFRCWGIVEGKDRIHLNRPYMGKLDFDPAWGFSGNIRIRANGVPQGSLDSWHPLLRGTPSPHPPVLLAEWWPVVH